MVIEPLVASVRDNLSIQGLKIDKNKHKISLYADDILLYITDPEKSTPHLQNTIKQFGTYSGYNINFSKSNAVLLHMMPTEELLSSCSFHWTPEGFKYLGISITSNQVICLKKITPSCTQDQIGLVKIVLPTTIIIRTDKCYQNERSPKT